MTSKRTLQDWLTTYLEYTSESEAPESFRLWVGIGVLAACLQRKCYIQFEGKQFPNLYIVLVGPAGKAKKGTAMRPAKELLEEIGVATEAEATTREGLIRSIKEANRSNSDGIVPLWHSSVTIFSTEMTVFFGYKNSQLISDLCDWFDCVSPWRYHTKTKELRDTINNIWVNIIAATTPGSLQASLPPEAFEGLVSRMIFVYEANKGNIIYLPPDVNVELLSGIEGKLGKEKLALKDKLLNDLQYILAMQGEFRMDDSFANLWIAFKNHHENNPLFGNTLLSSYDSRRQIKALKLSMIMSASRADDFTLTAKDLQRSISFLESAEVNMLKVFEGIGSDPRAAVFAKVIATLAGAGKILMSKVLDTLKYDVNREELMKMLFTLRAMGNVELNAVENDLEITYKETK